MMMHPYAFSPVTWRQAADLYAHCWHRYRTDEDSIGEQRRTALEALTEKAPGMKLYDAAHLERMLATLSPHVRAFLKSTNDPNVTSDLDDQASTSAWADTLDLTCLARRPFGAWRYAA